MKNSFLILIAAFAILPVCSQSPTDSTAHDLRLLIDADAFFVDNEFDGTMRNGYTLPGAWLRPRLSYDPVRNVHLELGVNALYFHGANRYPNFAYHDISNWKGAQHRQRGMHFMPWFRAEGRLEHLTLTLGSLYAPSQPQTCLDTTATRPVNHGLTLPLYNPESEFSTDPEQGVELFWHLPRYTMDAWLDWQSFIFNMDTHQEAFTVGVAQDILLTRPDKRGFRLSIPIQLQAQHRGGEIDDTHTGVQTLCNGAAGLRAQWNRPVSTLNLIEAEAMGLLSWQKDGHLWPFDTGAGAWCSARLQFWKRLDARLGMFYAQKFVSLYGSPYLGTLSMKHNAPYSHVATAYYGIEYTYPFAEGLSVSGQLHGYLDHCGTLNTSNPNVKTEPHLDHSFSFGIAFRARLDFLLKRFGKK